MAWIALTDMNGDVVRINADRILYYRANTRAGAATSICLGGNGEDRLIVGVTEPASYLDEVLKVAGKSGYNLDNV